MTRSSVKIAAAVPAPEGLEVDGLDALLAAGRRLRDLDPAMFARILAAARASVAAYDRPDESPEVTGSRIRQIYGSGSGLPS